MTRNHSSSQPQRDEDRGHPDSISDVWCIERNRTRDARRRDYGVESHNDRFQLDASNNSAAFRDAKPCPPAPRHAGGNRHHAKFS